MLYTEIAMGKQSLSRVSKDQVIRQYHNKDKKGTARPIKFVDLYTGTQKFHSLMINPGRINMK